MVDNNTCTNATDRDTSGQSADELRDTLAAIQTGQEEFREQVRNRAIQGFRDGEWDMDSLNASLERLDLAPYEPKHLAYTTLRLEVVLKADTGDADLAWSVVQDLEDLRAREAFKEAITNVVQDHLSADLAVTPSAGTLSASVGYPRVQIA